MLTTLYCDASFSHQERIGGWGIWLRSEKGRIVRGGQCPDYCQHSYEAELAAIFAGAWLTLEVWPQTTRILVRSDCDQALRLMDKRQRPHHDGAKLLTTKLHQLAERVTLQSRWVKGHQKGDHTSAWINRRVDQIARDRMRRARSAKARGA